MLGMGMILSLSSLPPPLSLSLSLQVVGEYAYEVEEDYEVENVLEKITGLLQLEFKGDSISLSLSLSISHCTYVSVLVMEERAGEDSHYYLFFSDVRTYSWIINSITRLIALIGCVPEYLHSQLALYLAWEDTDVQQVREHITLLYYQPHNLINACIIIIIIIVSFL